MKIKNFNIIQKVQQTPLSVFSLLSASIALGYLLISFFFLSPTYTSKSIISLKDNESGPSLLSSDLSFFSSSSKSLEMLRLFILSDEGIHSLLEVIEIDDVYGFPNVDPISSYKKVFTNPNTYIRNKLSLSIDPDADSLEISSIAFDPDQALRINLALIHLSNVFFTRNQQVSSRISMISNLCKLLLSQEELDNLFIIPEDTSETKNTFKQMDNASSQLYYSALQAMKNCNGEGRSKQINPSQSITYSGSSFINEVKSAYIEKNITTYYDDLVKSLTNPDMITVVSEPQKPLYEDDSQKVLLFFLIYLFSFLLFFSLKTLLRVYSDVL